MPANASSDATAAKEGGAWYSYAVVRIVPRPDREEFINAGIVLFARTLRFLEARIRIDEARLRVLDPEVNLERLKRHLATFQAIAAGDEAAGGPIAAQDLSERFHWLTAPRSTTIQTSPIHIGHCDDPRRALDDLMSDLVG